MDKILQQIKFVKQNLWLSVSQGRLLCFHLLMIRNKVCHKLLYFLLQGRHYIYMEEDW